MKPMSVENMEHVEVEFQLRPNSLLIAIGFVVVGLVLLSIFIVFKGPGTGGGSFLFGVLFSSAFILLGIWLFFTLIVKRRETPRSLSEQGVEIYGGTMISWANVSAIEQKPPTYPSGNLYEQTDIKFDNGRTATISSDWVTNFFEVNEFLVKKSHGAGIKGLEVSSTRSFTSHGGEPAITASTGREVTSPVLQQPQKGVAEMGSIAVEFSMAQYIYVILFTPGSIIFGVYLLSLFLQPSSKISGWTLYVLLLVAIVFIILGIAFPFMMRQGRKKVARSFSAQGVELWDGSVVPWNEVSVIAGGTEFIGTGNGGGSRYRKLDIKFRDGRGVYVSGYWTSNFSELENYLAQMPQYSP
jgi:hypothetical protein